MFKFTGKESALLKKLILIFQTLLIFKGIGQVGVVIFYLISMKDSAWTFVSVLILFRAVIWSFRTWIWLRLYSIALKKNIDEFFSEIKQAVFFTVGIEFLCVAAIPIIAKQVASGVQISEGIYATYKDQINDVLSFITPIPSGAMAIALLFFLLIFQNFRTQSN